MPKDFLHPNRDSSHEAGQCSHPVDTVCVGSPPDSKGDHHIPSVPPASWPPRHTSTTSGLTVTTATVSVESAAACDGEADGSGSDGLRLLSPAVLTPGRALDAASVMSTGRVPSPSPITPPPVASSTSPSVHGGRKYLLPKPSLKTPWLPTPPPVPATDTDPMAENRTRPSVSGADMDQHCDSNTGTTTNPDTDMSVGVGARKSSLTVRLSASRSGHRLPLPTPTRPPSPLTLSEAATTTDAMPTRLDAKDPSSANDDRQPAQVTRDGCTAASGGDGHPGSCTHRKEVEGRRTIGFRAKANRGVTARTSTSAFQSLSSETCESYTVVPPAIGDATTFRRSKQASDSDSELPIPSQLRLSEINRYSLGGAPDASRTQPFDALPRQETDSNGSSWEETDSCPSTPWEQRSKGSRRPTPQQQQQRQRHPQPSVSLPTPPYNPLVILTPSAFHGAPGSLSASRSVFPSLSTTPRPPSTPGSTLSMNTHDVTGSCFRASRHGSNSMSSAFNLLEGTRPQKNASVHLLPLISPRPSGCEHRSPSQQQKSEEGQGQPPHRSLSSPSPCMYTVRGRKELARGAASRTSLGTGAPYSGGGSVRQGTGSAAAVSHSSTPTTNPSVSAGSSNSTESFLTMSPAGGVMAHATAPTPFRLGGGTPRSPQGVLLGQSGGETFMALRVAEGSKDLGNPLEMQGELASARLTTASLAARGPGRTPPRPPDARVGPAGRSCHTSSSQTAASKKGNGFSFPTVLSPGEEAKPCRDKNQGMVDGLASPSVPLTENGTSPYKCRVSVSASEGPFSPLTCLTTHTDETTLSVMPTLPLLQHSVEVQLMSCDDTLKKAAQEDGAEDVREASHEPIIVIAPSTADAAAEPEADDHARTISMTAVTHDWEEPTVLCITSSSASAVVLSRGPGSPVLAIPLQGEAGTTNAFTGRAVAPTLLQHRTSLIQAGTSVPLITLFDLDDEEDSADEEEEENGDDECSFEADTSASDWTGQDTDRDTITNSATVLLRASPNLRRTGLGECEGARSIASFSTGHQSLFCAQSNTGPLPGRPQRSLLSKSSQSEQTVMPSLFSSNSAGSFRGRFSPPHRRGHRPLGQRQGIVRVEIPVTEEGAVDVTEHKAALASVRPASSRGRSRSARERRRNVASKREGSDSGGSTHMNQERNARGGRGKSKRRKEKKAASRLRLRRFKSNKTPTDNEDESRKKKSAGVSEDGEESWLLSYRRKYFARQIQLAGTPLPPAIPANDADAPPLPFAAVAGDDAPAPCWAKGVAGGGTANGEATTGFGNFNMLELFRRRSVAKGDASAATMMSLRLASHTPETPLLGSSKGCENSRAVVAGSAYSQRLPTFGWGQSSVSLLSQRLCGTPPLHGLGASHAPADENSKWSLVSQQQQQQQLGQVQASNLANTLLSGDVLSGWGSGDESTMAMSSAAAPHTQAVRVPSRGILGPILHTAPYTSLAVPSPTQDAPCEGTAGATRDTTATPSATAVGSTCMTPLVLSDFSVATPQRNSLSLSQQSAASACPFPFSPNRRRVTHRQQHHHQPSTESCGESHGAQTHHQGQKGQGHLPSQKSRTTLPASTSAALEAACASYDHDASTIVLAPSLTKRDLMDRQSDGASPHRSSTRKAAPVSPTSSRVFSPSYSLRSGGLVPPFATSTTERGGEDQTRRHPTGQQMLGKASTTSQKTLLSQSPTSADAAELAAVDVMMRETGKVDLSEAAVADPHCPDMPVLLDTSHMSIPGSPRGPRRGRQFRRQAAQGTAAQEKGERNSGGGCSDGTSRTGVLAAASPLSRPALPGESSNSRYFQHLDQLRSDYSFECSQAARGDAEDSWLSAHN